MKIFKRENILILVLIVGAILGIVGLPQKIGITTDQLVLGLLGVLAVDTLIERLGYLERIENRITELKNKLEVKTSADNLFRTRSELPAMTTWLTQYDEICFLGVNLNAIVHSYTRQIEEGAKNGKHFRFILVDPESNSPWDTVAARSFTEPNAANQRQLAADSLAILKRISNNVPKKSIEVRLINYDLPCSYSIGDGNTERGKVIVEFFNYKISAGERQHITLLKQTEPIQFRFHLQQFETIWKGAKVVSELKR